VKLRRTGEDPVIEELVEFTGTEGNNLEIIPAGDFAVTVGDTGITDGAGVIAGDDDVGTGVCVARGLSGSIHPAIAITMMRKPINTIPEYFIVYPHRFNIKNLMILILQSKTIGTFH
jgi:hypothetical protein